MLSLVVVRFGEKSQNLPKNEFLGLPLHKITSCVRVKLKKCLFSLGSIVPKIIDCYQTNQNDVRNEKIHSELMYNFFKVKVSFLTGVGCDTQIEPPSTTIGGSILVPRPVYNIIKESTIIQIFDL